MVMRRFLVLFSPFHRTAFAVLVEPFVQTSNVEGIPEYLECRNTPQFAFTKDCCYNKHTTVIREKGHREDWSVDEVLACSEKLQ
jgi:hypothetical protein